MVIASIFDAKTNLSKYIAAILDKKEPFVVISRNGKPVAKIVPYEEEKTKRIGVGKGILPKMPSLDEFNDFDLELDFVAEDTLLW